MRVVVGIDLSVQCPAMCVHVGDTWASANCQYFYVYAVKKWLRNGSGLVSTKLRKANQWGSDEERIEWITSWFMCHLAMFSDPEVYIEDYSYTEGSSSTHILAECCGVLKNKIHREGFKLETPSVGTIKKFATGKGNAQKGRMFEAYKNESSYLQDVLPCPEGKSPLADLVDAHFICKLGHSKKR